MASAGGWSFTSTRADIDRIGVRLAAGSLTDDEELCFQRFIEYCDGPLAIVSARLRDAGLSHTTRRKNRGTIREKLRREPHLVLSRMQDIVGCRVVLDASEGRLSQRLIVERLRRDLVDLRPKVTDRIGAPRRDYRAVHVIVRTEGVPVERQVRTWHQHGWAENV